MAEDEKLGLDNLSPPRGSKHKRKRVGRGHGSGHGKTSGRGHKGQKSRAGSKIPPWFEGGQMPLHRRLPKRGFTNPNRVEYQVVNLGDLAAVDEPEIGPEQLRASGLANSPTKPVKVLGGGAIGRAVTLRAHAFSSSAREKVEAAGGRVEIID